MLNVTNRDRYVNVRPGQKSPKTQITKNSGRDLRLCLVNAVGKVLLQIYGLLCVSVRLSIHLVSRVPIVPMSPCSTSYQFIITQT